VEEVLFLFMVTNPQAVYLIARPLDNDDVFQERQKLKLAYSRMSKQVKKRWEKD